MIIRFDLLKSRGSIYQHAVCARILLDGEFLRKTGENCLNYSNEPTFQHAYDNIFALKSQILER